MTPTRIVYVVGLSMYCAAALADAADPDRVGLYEWVATVGWASAMTAVAMAVVTGFAASARRMADPAVPVRSRPLQLVADTLASIVSGLVAWLLGEAIEARPAVVGLMAVALGWSGAQLLDAVLRRWLERWIPTGGGNGGD